MRPTTLATALAITAFAFGSAVAQQAPVGAQGQPQGQNQAFCLQGPGGAKNCGFQTMAQCDAARKGATNSTCVRNTATTGSGAVSPNPSQPTTGMQPSNPSGPAGSSTKK